MKENGLKKKTLAANYLITKLLNKQQTTMCLGGRIHGRCCDGPKVIKPNVTVPLIGASSKVTVMDFVAQVELKQRYENQVGYVNLSFRPRIRFYF